MKHHVIQSGSDGNAVILQGEKDVILVDCGVSFAKLAPYRQAISLVLLTHIHGDHFRPATIKRLAYLRPTLRFMVPSWLLFPLLNQCDVDERNIDLAQMNATAVYGDRIKVRPFELVHDVPNCGYEITFDKSRIVYATDTSYMPDIYNADYYFIEANYKNAEELAARAYAKIEAGQYVYENGLQDRHFSREQAINYIMKNGKDNSQHVLLHEHRETKEKEE